MNWLEILGTIVGLAYLWLEYRANMYVWLAGIIMPAIYSVVYYQAGLYADFGINVYYILAAVYGVAMWLRKPHSTSADGATPIVHTPLAMVPWLTCAFLMLWAGIAAFLFRFTDSTVPISDAFTTSLSIVAMYMLAHKHAEQWLAWIAVDAVCTGLYIYKELYFTAALYALYTVVAIAGYRKWSNMAIRQ